MKTQKFRVCLLHINKYGVAGAITIHNAMNKISCSNEERADFWWKKIQGWDDVGMYIKN